jgi:anti-sigma factor RsiW
MFFVERDWFCSTEALARSQLKRSIHHAGKEFVPSTEFRKEIYEQIPRRSTRWSRNAVPQFAVAALALVLVAAVSMVWLHHHQKEQLVGELTDLHVATLASSNPVDVISSDRHTVKPWFQGKVPFTFNLPELAGSPFELFGGRLTYLDQDPGAQLSFAVRKHLLSVFIFKDSADFDRVLGSNGTMQKLSFNLQSWTENGLRYIVVTDAARAYAENLRARFAAAASQ